MFEMPVSMRLSPPSISLRKVAVSGGTGRGWEGEEERAGLKLGFLGVVPW